METATVEAEASRCVILAIKAPDVINFEELLELTAVKQLQSKNKDLFSFLNLFTQTSTKDFKKELGKHAALMKKEGLSEEEVQLKKTYERICSLPTEKSNFKFSELAELLDVSVRQ